MVLLFLLALLASTSSVVSSSSSSIPGPFPTDFFIASATASYQVEGAYKEDGRGWTIWDTFTHAGKCYNNETGDVADDHYNRVVEDIALSKALGFKAYRMSFAWSRILPTGSLPLNQAGVDHYNREIDALLAAGITPFVTLFHWDLPQPLEDQGGWLTHETSLAFAAYAEQCYKIFGDRVKNWFTINEPHTVAMNGYCSGAHAPGRCSDRKNCAQGNGATEPYIAAHHMLLGHAYASDVYRTKYAKSQNGKITIVLDAMWVEPLDPSSPADIAAANKAMEFYVGWFADPIYTGDYPPSMRAAIGERLPKFTKQQSDLLINSTDYFALNHYTSAYATPTPVGPNPNCNTDSGVSTPRERNGVVIGPPAASPWLYVVPRGLRHMPVWIRDRYSPSNNLYFYVTENGVDVPGENNMPLEQALNDTFRVDFYRDYLNELLKAITIDKVNVKGYFAWSLMDNFEWNDGYHYRFGIHYVDYKTQTRYQKNSAKFLASLLKQQ